MNKGWKNYKLNELIEYKNGLWAGKKSPFTSVKVIRSTEFNDDGTYNLETAKELEVESSKLKERTIKPSQILLERSGGGENKPVGRVIVFKDDVKDNVYSFSNFTTLLIPKESIVYPKFLFYYLHFFYTSGQTNYYQKAMIGIRNLEFKRYLQQEISVPFKNNQPDLAEQRRITDKIDKLFAEVERGEAKVNSSLGYINRLFNSELQKLFKRSSNETWKEVPLVDLIDQKAKYNIGKIQKTEYKIEGKFPIIDQSQDFIAGYSDDEKLAYSGKLPVVIFGDHTLITKLVNFRFIQGADGIKILIPKNDVSSEFLLYLIESNKPKSKGYTRHFKKLKEIIYSIPMKDGLPDKIEQARLANKMSNIKNQVGELMKNYNEQLNNFSLLCQSALNQAFVGKL